MINYTECISRLMEDVVRRTPSLSFIKVPELLVFARFGRTDAEGAFATCHCLTLPTSEPGYFFWKDRETGQLTRRSEWFITKSPSVRVGGQRITYLISFVLPRFPDQSLERSRKAERYPGAPLWVGKLDTIVHELYHIDPEEGGLRRVKCSDGTESPRSHGPEFYESVTRIVMGYLASNPDPSLLEFLQYDFAGLDTRFGGVVATTFRNFPSFPQRYMERFDGPGAELRGTVKIEPLKPVSQPELYTESDLHVRQFTQARTCRLPRNGQPFAA